jgi:putative NADPH-quinone reductase
MTKKTTTEPSQNSSKILIVVGHPLRQTLCESLAEQYARGAQDAGHHVTTVLLADVKFDPILREGYRRVQKLEPDLEKIAQDLASCDHLALFFPLWCGDMPALLKGFIERILQPDLIARHNTEGAMNWRLFSNKTAHIVMTMGMPASIYRFWYGAHALKLLKNNILKFIGIKPVRETLFGMVTDVPSKKHEAWLKQMYELGFKAESAISRR